MIAEMKEAMYPKYGYLPIDHQPGGKRERHDDWLPGLRWIKRIWTTAPCIKPPRMLCGNQEYWIDSSSGNEAQHCNSGIYWLKFKNDRGEDEFLRGEENKKIFQNPPWGPAPIPRPGEWQLSLVYAGKIPLPYFCIRFQNKWVVMLGLARWTNPTLDQKKSYVEFIAFGCRPILDK